MTFFRALAGLNHRAVLHRSQSFGIPQFRKLVVKYREIDSDEIERLSYFSTPCFAEFVTPKTGNSEENSHVITTDDYLVTGIDITERSIDDFIKHGVGYWLDGELVGGALKSGMECELLTYTQHFATLDLYLRRKPSYRR